MRTRRAPRPVSPPPLPRSISLATPKSPGVLAMRRSAVLSCRLSVRLSRWRVLLEDRRDKGPLQHEVVTLSRPAAHDAMAGGHQATTAPTRRPIPYVTNNATPPPITRRVIAGRRLGPAEPGADVAGQGQGGEDRDERNRYPPPRWRREYRNQRKQRADRERHGGGKGGLPRTCETFRVNAQVSLEKGRERSVPGEFFGHNARRRPGQTLRAIQGNKLGEFLCGVSASSLRSWSISARSVSR